MSADPYQPGTTIALTADFTVGSDDAPADPTTVTFNIRQPDGSLLTYVYLVDDNVIRTAVGVYKCTLTPAMSGEFRYNAVGTGAVPISIPGTFGVVQSNVDPPTPPPAGPVLGPGQAWIAGEDVASCCNANYGEFTSVLDTVALEASMALFELSGRQFHGLCGPITVRPARDPEWCWPSSMGLGPWQWSWLPGQGYGWWNPEGGRSLGCEAMSVVKLQNYPVREIVEVKIGGVVLPPLDDNGHPNYRLDNWRDLVRMNSPESPTLQRKWPGCQDMSLDSSQGGTFAVTYKWGVDPPQIGRDAAIQIACQLFKSCSGAACEIPTNATRVTRQGITVDRGLLVNWFNPKVATGIVAVDLFLASYWQARGARRPAVWSPDVQPFARREGV